MYCHGGVKWNIAVEYWKCIFEYSCLKKYFFVNSGEMCKHGKPLSTQSPTTTATSLCIMSKIYELILDARFIVYVMSDMCVVHTTIFSPTNSSFSKCTAQWSISPKVLIVPVGIMPTGALFSLQFRNVFTYLPRPKCFLFKTLHKRNIKEVSLLKHNTEFFLN